jgi:hypothetical protein
VSCEKTYESIQMKQKSNNANDQAMWITWWRDVVIISSLEVCLIIARYPIDSSCGNVFVVNDVGKNSNTPRQSNHNAPINEVCVIFTINQDVYVIILYTYI